jgi:hypothetical protein
VKNLTRSLLVFASLSLAIPTASAADRPSRAAVQGCKWERVSSDDLGFAAWVQRCDFGYRKVAFVLRGSTLFSRFSDGGELDRDIEILPLHAGENEEAGLRRIFAERSSALIAKRCVLARFDSDPPAPAGVKRYSFVANAAYRKQQDAIARAAGEENDIPDPECGDWGHKFDSVEYFETHPGSGARSVLYIRAGQDTPLFDEQTLQLRAPSNAAKKK